MSRDISESTLTAVAHRLRDVVGRSYPKVFIAYWLNEADVGKGAYAISHFRPDAEIRLLGRAPGAASADVTREPQNRGKRIGRWAYKGPGASVTAIYQRGSIYVAEAAYRDGSAREEGLVRERSASGLRFRILDNDHGEFFVIDGSGDLQLFDRAGLIRTDRRVP